MAAPSQEFKFDMDVVLPYLEIVRHQLMQCLNEQLFGRIKLQLKVIIADKKRQGKMNNIIITARPKDQPRSLSQRISRGSRHRGVSRNKKKWQMMFMLHRSRIYMGTLQSEEEAARLYDVVAITSKGVNAQTNYSYTANDVETIVAYFYQDCFKREEPEEKHSEQNKRRRDSQDNLPFSRGKLM